MSDKAKDKEKEPELTFPSAMYKDGESKLVNSQEEADAAESDGWSHEPSAEPLPAEPDKGRPGQGLPGDRPDRPGHGLPGGGDRPHAEQPIAETPKPKKKD